MNKDEEEKRKDPASVFFTLPPSSFILAGLPGSGIFPPERLFTLPTTKGSAPPA
jgi:hypothetical protein